MKLKIWLDSGANIHSCKEQILDFEDLGLTEEEWDASSEQEKEEMTKEIAFESLDWGFKKVN